MQSLLPVGLGCDSDVGELRDGLASICDIPNLSAAALLSPSLTVESFWADLSALTVGNVEPSSSVLTEQLSLSRLIWFSAARSQLNADGGGTRRASAIPLPHGFICPNIIIMNLQMLLWRCCVQ